MPSSSLHPEDGGSMVLWEVGILSQHYTASEPRRPRLESSPLWEPKILHLFFIFL